MYRRTKEQSFHIEIESSKPSVRFVSKPNITWDELRERILVRYDQGDVITLKGVNILPSEIVRIQIFETEDRIPPTNLHDRIIEYLYGHTVRDATDALILGPPGWRAARDDLSQTDRAKPQELYDHIVTHEQIRDVSRKRFLDGYYSDAVVEGFKCLNNAVKDKSGRTALDGADLMRTVFSANSPILKLNVFQSQSDRNEQLGYMDIFAGSMTGIRNPRAHDHQIVDEPKKALDILVLANHLMQMLEESGPAT